jgi:hypothetical protein
MAAATTAPKQIGTADLEWTFPISETQYVEMRTRLIQCASAVPGVNMKSIEVIADKIINRTNALLFSSTVKQLIEVWLEQADGWNITPEKVEAWTEAVINCSDEKWVPVKMNGAAQTVVAAEEKK